MKHLLTVTELLLAPQDALDVSRDADGLLQVLTEDATNEKGSPHLVAISWESWLLLVGLVEDVLHLLTMLVEGLVHVLWDDLLDADGPGFKGGQTQRRLDVVVLLQDVEGLREELGKVVLGVVLALVLGFCASSALGLGVRLVLLARCWSLFLSVVILDGEVALKD